MSTRPLSLLALLAATSCAAPAAAPPVHTAKASPGPSAAAHTSAAASPPAPPLPAGMRLPATVSPVRYAATLTVVPDAATLNGEIDIDLSVREPTSVIWLNAKEIAVHSASIEVGGRRIPATVVPGDDERIGLSLPEPLPAGAARAHVAYTAAISGDSDRGVFKEEEGGALYAFTQFENTEARRAFPCFDEPSFKVPWQLTLRVRKTDVALSNTPVASESTEGDMKQVRFAPTKPLPSYLIAFAVGPFDLVDAGKAGKNGTPVRIVVPRGKASEAATAAAATPALVQQIEDIFGLPYGYEKLDLIAVPRLISFGAMENAGLITCAQSILLARPEEDTVAFKRRFAAVAAHEIAHQWFGDLVTMAWWDDVWLNESFATWMEPTTLIPWKPEWRWEAERARDAAFAMRSDSLVNARRIRQSITSYDDIDNAFDAITYDKGAAVLTMFEAWIGPERFRRGVRRYLTEHANGNATAGDFLAAVSAEAGREVRAPFSTFLDQPGVPLIKAVLKCDKGSKPRVELAQERYFPAGSPGASAQTWQVPVCVRYGAGGATGRACTLLTERTGALELADAPRCPDWLFPNEGGNGYYHVAYGPAALDATLRGGKQLTLPERLALIQDMAALIRSGKLPAADALARLPELAKDPTPDVQQGLIELVDGLRDELIPAALRPNFARFVQKTFGARARALGWQPKPGEDEATRMLRPELLRLVADRGDDKALASEAASLGARWLDAPKALAADMIDPVLGIAAQHGDRALFDRLHAEAKKEKDQNRRAHLLRALSSFRDPALVREGLGLLLTNEFDLRDALRLFFQDARMADVVFAFYKQNFDALMTKIPTGIQSETLHVASPLCDAPHRAEVESFFKGRAEKLLGGTRTMAQVLEQISLCTALRDAQEASLTAFLKKY